MPLEDGSRRRPPHWAAALSFAALFLMAANWLEPSRLTATFTRCLTALADLCH